MEKFPYKKGFFEISYKNGNILINVLQKWNILERFRIITNCLY